MTLVRPTHEKLRSDLLEMVVDWREQATAEEHCQRSGGNPKGALAYRNCADDLEELVKTIAEID